MKLQVLAGLLSSAQGRTNSEKGHRLIFGAGGVGPGLWQEDFVKDLVKVKFPKSWQKWINNKSGQLEKLGEKTQRTFDRCGEEST